MRVPEPMLAVPVDVLPLAGVAYEGKWDGYRCLLARHPDGRVELRSRRGTALTVAFGDIAAAAERDLPGSGVLLDGELVVWHEGRLAFDRLQRRLNRTAATVAREIREAPAHFVAFDVLHLADEDLMVQPYLRRRERLERFFAEERLGAAVGVVPDDARPRGGGTLDGGVGGGRRRPRRDRGEEAEPVLPSGG